MLEVKTSVLEMYNSFGRPKCRLDTAGKRQNLKTGQEHSYMETPKNGEEGLKSDVHGTISVSLILRVSEEKERKG